MPFSDKPTQVIGYDAVKCRGQSQILAVVGTINNKFNRYFSKVKKQDGSIGEGMRELFKECYEAFFKACGVYPARVIVYRNGVGES